MKRTNLWLLLRNLKWYVSKVFSKLLILSVNCITRLDFFISTKCEVYKTENYFSSKIWQKRIKYFRKKIRFFVIKTLKRTEIFRNFSYQYFFVKSGRFLTSSSFCWSALVPFELDDDSYSIENRHNSFEASSHHFNEISISL